MTNNLLGGLSPEIFLKKYWQKKPLLIRNAFPNFKSPLTKKDFLDFACNEDVASRLVIERGGDYDWQVIHGPLKKKQVKSLPETHWTILLQEMNSHHAEVAKLLNYFSFIPNWRVDDIMISYAVKEGSVGPHTDNYDVFLLQGSGRRKWKINHTPVEDEQLIENLDLRILKYFSTDEEWILEPGDMLYLPPKIAHYGISMDDDCMTYSVGFRTPSMKELLVGYASHLMEYVQDNAFYEDPDLKLQNHSGEIQSEAITEMQKLFKGMTSNRDMFESWLGRFVTESKRGFFREMEKPQTEIQIGKKIEKGATLIRHGSTKISYLKSETCIKLFVNGGELELPLKAEKFIQTVTSKPEIENSVLQKMWKKKDEKEMVVELLNLGYFGL